jgi:WD40 repeat protein
VVAESPKSLGFWDVRTGKQRLRLAAPQELGGLLQVSPDGKLLAAGAFRGTVQLWSFPSGQQLGVCLGAGADLRALTFPGGDQVLAAGLSDRAAVLWDVPSGRVRTPEGWPFSIVEQLAFSADGKRLLAGGAEGLRFWDLETGKTARRQPALGEDRSSEPLFPLALSPDGRYAWWGVGEGNGGGEPRVMETATGREIFRVKDLAATEELSVAFHPDGKTAATLSQRRTEVGQKIRLRLWDLETGRHLQEAVFSGGAQPEGLSLALAGTLVAVARNESGQGNESVGLVTVWDRTKGKERHRLSVAEGFRVLAFSPDGAMLAVTAESSGDVGLWDMASGVKLPVLEGRVEGEQAGLLAFAPDSRTLAVSLWDEEKGHGRVLVWELASGGVRAEVTGHRGAVTSLAFSRDSRVLAAGGADTTVLLWDLAGKPRARPAEPKALWGELEKHDARQAHEAMLRLEASPAQALELIRGQVRPVPGKDLAAPEVQRLIADLDSEQFEIRDRASRTLAQADRAVQAALEQALEAKPSAEKKRRLEELLDALRKPETVGPDLLRALRALEILERLGTPEARQHLEALSKGQAEHRLTREARAALARLTRKP